MKNGDSTLGIVGGLTIGFVVAMLALLSLFGGLILVGLMLVMGIFVFGFLALEGIFGKQPVYVTSFKTVELPAKVAAKTSAAAPVLPEKVPAGRVYVRATRVVGPCPEGYQVKAGDTWVLNGEPLGTARLCANAYQTFREYARSGNGMEKVVRCADGHVCMEFKSSVLQLRGKVAAAG